MEQPTCLVTYMEVAVQFEAEEPATLQVNCLAHSLNLCFKDASWGCSCVGDSLELVMEVVKQFKFSPKCTTPFEQMKANLSPQMNSLKTLCPTSWTVHSFAILAVLNKYEALISTLDKVHSTG